MGKQRSYSDLVKRHQSNPVPAPNIAYFAWRGGLAPTANTYPPRLSNDPFDYVSESSNGTSKAQYHVGLGLQKYFSDIEDFRRKGASNGVKVDDKLVREKFKEVAFIQGPLPSGSPEESAKEVFAGIVERWPELKEFPPSDTEPAAEPGMPRNEERSGVLKRARQKVSDPSNHPHMTAREVAALLGISLNSVYDHPCLKRYPTGNRTVLFTTQSVIEILNS